MPILFNISRGFDNTIYPDVFRKLDMFLPLGDARMRNLGRRGLLSRVNSMDPNKIIWSKENGVFLPSDSTDGTPEGDKHFSFRQQIDNPSNMSYTIGAFVHLTEYKSTESTAVTSQILYGSSGSAGYTNTYRILTRESGNRHIYGIINYNSTELRLTDYDDVPLNTWVHLALSSNGKFYINGDLISQNTNPPVSARGSYFAHYPGGTPNSTVCLRNFYLSNYFVTNDKILTDDEILEIYNLGQRPFYG